MSRRCKIVKKKNLVEFVILGERNSGTNYLEKLLITNFNTKWNREYGSKHFFGFDDYSKNSNNILFICIIRNFTDWANSTFQKPYHLQRDLRISKDNFLNLEFWSYNDEFSGMTDDRLGKEIMEDRNIYTKKRYKNIFELREKKLKYLSEDLKDQVKNYILIKYEDLVNNFEDTMKKIKNLNLLEIKVKNFPQNIHQVGIKTTKKIIFKEDIVRHPDYNFELEKKFYN